MQTKTRIVGIVEGMDSDRWPAEALRFATQSRESSRAEARRRNTEAREAERRRNVEHADLLGNIEQAKRWPRFDQQHRSPTAGGPLNAAAIFAARNAPPAKATDDVKEESVTRSTPPRSFSDLASRYYQGADRNAGPSLIAVSARGGNR